VVYKYHKSKTLRKYFGLYENTGKDISDMEQLSFKDNYEVMCDAIRIIFEKFIYFEKAE